MTRIVVIIRRCGEAGQQTCRGGKGQDEQKMTHENLHDVDFETTGQGIGP
jgi:hypothetical protein